MRKTLVCQKCGHQVQASVGVKYTTGLPPGSFQLSWGVYSVTCPACKHQGQAKLHEPREVHTRPVSGPRRK